MDFSLRVNRKQIATNSTPYRDQQFQYLDLTDDPDRSKSL
jgi:hypothetical protein